MKFVGLALGMTDFYKIEQFLSWLFLGQIKNFISKSIFEEKLTHVTKGYHFYFWKRKIFFCDGINFFFSFILEKNNFWLKVKKDFFLMSHVKDLREKLPTKQVTVGQRKEENEKKDWRYIQTFLQFCLFVVSDNDKRTMPAGHEK